MAKTVSMIAVGSHGQKPRGRTRAGKKKGEEEGKETLDRTRKKTKACFVVDPERDYDENRYVVSDDVVDECAIHVCSRLL
jgi:hypothetical protein